MKYLLIYFCLSFLCIEYTFSQQYTLKGNVRAASNNMPFANATVSLLNSTDSLLLQETVTDADGTFDFRHIEAGDYLLSIQYLGYEKTQEAIEVHEHTDVGTLFLWEAATVLDEITISARPPVGEQRGDTTQFNAAAFQTMKDASAQNLIEKMPGINTAEGSLQAQGENIVQILVDGKPFFGTDVK